MEMLVHNDGRACVRTSAMDGTMLAKPVWSAGSQKIKRWTFASRAKKMVLFYKR